jgi:hypothetical protein
MKLDSWNPEKRREAIGYLIDSLDQAKGFDEPNDALVVIMDALGGGEIVFSDSNGYGTKLVVDRDRPPLRKGDQYGGSSFIWDSAPNAPSLSEVQRTLRAMLEKSTAKPQ